MASAIETSLGTTETSVALLKALAENSFDSILITDATARGKIIYANKAFKKLTGHDPAGVIGKTPRILQGKGTDKKGGRPPLRRTQDWKEVRRESYQLQEGWHPVHHVLESASNQSGEKD